jgi:hypothetical protein
MMGMVVIDIDKLLDATADLTSEKNYKMKPVEIDKLLENTKDW